jgi:small subunit ribosomal protein S5
MSEEQTNISTTEPTQPSQQPTEVTGEVVIKTATRTFTRDPNRTNRDGQSRPFNRDRNFTPRPGSENRPPRQGGFRDGNRPPRDPNAPRPSFNRRDGGPRDGQRPGGFSRNGPGGRGNDRRNPRAQDVQELESKVIEVRRVTRVVKGGKRMRFSALVVVGDRQGKVGFGLKKGLDFQDAVAKATKKANNSLIKVEMDKNKSISFPSNTKHKSSEIFLRPATHGIGLIAGGFIRPVLELAGIENAYTKINRSRNKVVGVQCVIQALSKYSRPMSKPKVEKVEEKEVKETK